MTQNTVFLDWPTALKLTPSYSPFILFHVSQTTGTIAYPNLVTKIAGRIILQAVKQH